MPRRGMIGPSERRVPSFEAFLSRNSSLSQPPASQISSTTRYWGVMRQLDWMPAESIANAIVAVVTAPQGTHLDLVEVVPESSKREPAPDEDERQ